MWTKGWILGAWACLFLVPVSLCPAQGVGGWGDDPTDPSSAPPKSAAAEKTIRKLLATLTDGKPAQRVSAAKRLGALRVTQAVGPLLNCLKQNAPDLRLAAVEALGAIQDAKAVEPLLGQK